MFAGPVTCDVAGRRSAPLPNALPWAGWSAGSHTVQGLLGPKGADISK